jgi:uncharacterized 2Fe-2S/4Fe-4S cluster protein (DUF4445 family)
MAALFTLHVVQGDRSSTLKLGPADVPLSLTEILRRYDLPLNTRCGQRGLCDGCLVDIKQGRVRCNGGSVREASDGGESVRACECRIDTTTPELTLHVPARSAMTHTPQVLTDFKINVPWANDPLEADHAGRLGVAIDLGTTTVVVLLVDRFTGQILARYSDFNRQIHYADDVLSRINLCASSFGMLAELHDSVVRKTIAPLLHRALAEHHATPADLGCITVAGNTTMLHLLALVDPTPMGIAPFTPSFIRHTRLDAAELGMIDRPVAVHLLPSAAAYVGADITAGMLASRLAYDQGPCLLVDAGTNGEIVLNANGGLLGCATAAGPAFEGAGLVSGMRASSGAISHVRFGEGDTPLVYEVIGDGQPVGLCGSAYIDLLAEGVRHGWLSHTGRIASDIAHAAHLALKPINGCGHAMRVAKGLGNKDVLLAETDIANLLQAKAAIAAGILTLLRQAGITQRDIHTLYLAGGFGMHMNIANAIGCGLLPGFTVEQVELVGNSSLAGAYLAMLDRGALNEMQRIADRVRIIELNLDPDFEMTYIEQLAL